MAPVVTRLTLGRLVALLAAGVLAATPTARADASSSRDRCLSHACSVVLHVAPGAVVTFTTPRRFTAAEALEVHVQAGGASLTEDSANLTRWRFYGAGVAVDGDPGDGRKASPATFRAANATPWPRRVRITWRRWWVGR